MVNLNTEFQRQYTGTFIYCLGEQGEKIPLYVDSSIGGEDGPHTVIANKLIPRANGDVRMDELVEIPFEDVSLSPIPLGCINLRKHATYFAWRQDRQWKRGFRRQRVNFRTAMSSVMPSRVYLLRNMMGGNKDIYQIFNPVYYNIEEACNKIQNSVCLSVALNRQFWVGISPILDNIMLGYKMWPVGFIDEKEYTAHLIPDFSHLAQELSEVVEVGRNANL